jgi:ubiquinone/menaquinone biosynthesis C-methylase UbiE
MEDFVDTETVLREWIRVLRPGARLISRSTGCIARYADNPRTITLFMRTSRLTS